MSEVSPELGTDLGNPDRHRIPSLVKVNLIGLETIVLKEVRRVLRIWLQTIVPPAITMTLYFFIVCSRAS